jgi:hypothetical protein
MITVIKTKLHHVVEDWPCANKRGKAVFQISNCRKFATRTLNGKMDAERFDYCTIAICNQNKTWIVGVRGERFFLMPGTFKKILELTSEKDKMQADEVLRGEIVV